MLLNLIVAGSCALLLWTERGRAIEDARTEAVNLTRLLERNVQATLDQTSSLLKSVGGRIEKHLNGNAIDRTILADAMEVEVKTVPFIQRIAAFDATGEQVCRPTPAECPRINVKDRDYFQRFLNDRSSKPFLAGPLESRIDGQPAMILARALSGSEGAFVGVVIAVLPVSKLGEALSSVNLYGNGAASLRTTDLTLLARKPELRGADAEQAVQRISEVLRAALHQQPDFGTYKAVTASDGIERQMSYLRVAEYPLYVFVGMASKDFLSSWNRFATAVAVLLVALVSGSLMLRQLVRTGMARDKQIRRLYDTAPCGYHTLDGAGVYTNINETELRWIGARRSDVVGKRRLADYLTAPSQAKLAAQLEQLGTSGHFEGLELELVDAHGGIRHVAASADAIHDSYGNFLLGNAVLYDITDLHEARLRLFGLAQEQALMLDTDLVGIVKLRDRRIVWKNRGADRIFGYTGADWDNMPTRTLHKNEEAYLRVGEEGYAAMNAGQIYLGQEQMVRKDGSLVWIDARGVALASDPGTVMMLWSDITAIKEAAEKRLEALALSAQNAHLAEEGRLKDVLLSNMAHELRTPLNGVIGFSQLIAMTARAQGLDKLEDYASKIELSGNRLLQIIDSMLDYAAQEAGKLQFHPVAVSLADSISDAVHMLEPEISRREMVLDIDLDAAPLSVYTDRVRLRQILLQLLDNAIKFSHQKGRVLVRALPDGDMNFRVEVVDHGIGIAASHMEQLFVKFQQLSSGNTKRYSGTGIGLALVKRLVEGQGGTVECTSELGLGSTFSISMPRHAPPASDSGRSQK